MTDMPPNDIEEDIAEHAQTITNAKLEDLTRSSTEGEIDNNREADD